MCTFAHLIYLFCDENKDNNLGWIHKWIQPLIFFFSKVLLDSDIIWENHSFWRNISREGAFFPFCGSGNRQSSGTSVHIVRLSVQRDCGFFVKCLFLWRRLCGGCDEPFDAPSLASSHSSQMQLWHYSQGNLWAAPTRPIHPTQARAMCAISKPFPMITSRFIFVHS